MKIFCIKRIERLYFATAFMIAMALPAWAQATQMTSGQAVQHDTSPPLSEMVAAAAATPVIARPNRQVPIGVRPEMGGKQPNLATPDGGLQAPSWFLAPTPGPILSVSGLSEQDNVNTIGGAIVPPDVNGDIGLDDNGNRIYIQYINSIWGVFNVTGNLINGPFAGNTFWTGFGGPCETNNDVRRRGRTMVFQPVLN